MMELIRMAIAGLETTEPLELDQALDRFNLLASRVAAAQLAILAGLAGGSWAITYAG